MRIMIFLTLLIFTYQNPISEFGDLLTSEGYQMKRIIEHKAIRDDIFIEYSVFTKAFLYKKDEFEFIVHEYHFDSSNSVDSILSKIKKRRDSDSTYRLFLGKLFNFYYKKDNKLITIDYNYHFYRNGRNSKVMDHMKKRFVPTNPVSN